MSNDIPEILASAKAAIDAAVEAAFKRGYDDGYIAGKQEAMAGFKSRLASLFEGETPVATETPSEAPSYATVSDLLTSPDHDASQERAAPGTVKPLVLSVVANSNIGMTTRAIQAVTGIKYNSVRGTLWQLQKEDAVTRDDGGRWIATPPVKEAAKKDMLERYAEEIERANQALNNEAPAGEPEGASKVTDEEVPASSSNMGSGND